MSNLVITNSCNLSCPFCFATEYRSTNADLGCQHMFVEEFIKQIGFIEANTVRFCGGEPTLHPQFKELLAIALEKRNRRVFIMTNGIWPESVQQGLHSLSRAKTDRISYLVNVLEPDRYEKGQRLELEKTLGLLDARRVTLGTTIFPTLTGFTYLFKLAKHFGIRNLRYSVAAPTLTDPRSWTVDPATEFESLATMICHLVREARKKNLMIQSDCGYIPPCMFTAEQLNTIFPKSNESSVDAFRCHGPVDIGPGGEAWRCYGIYSILRARTDDFKNIAELSSYFERQLKTLNNKFLFDQCAHCEHRKNGMCGGGCYGFRAVRTLKRLAVDAGICIDNDEEFLKAVPQINPKRLRFWSHGNHTKLMYKDAEGVWEEKRIGVVEENLLRSCDGIRTIGQLIESFPSFQQRSRVLSTALLREVRKLFFQGAITLQ